MRRLRLLTAWELLAARAEAERACDSAESLGLWQNACLLARAVTRWGRRRFASGAAVMELFQQLHDGGSTIIMITHDHSIANHAAKVMTIRDGVLSGGDDYE